jgi:hypothetical protein
MVSRASFGALYPNTTEAQGANPGTPPDLLVVLSLGRVASDCKDAPMGLSLGPPRRGACIVRCFPPIDSIGHAFATKPSLIHSPVARDQLRSQGRTSVCTPDKHSKMTAPHLVLKNTRNEPVPWVPSQGDFATDWAIVLSQAL